MSTTRRGFLKTIGMGAVGAAAVAVTSCVTPDNEGDWDRRPWVDKSEEAEPPPADGESFGFVSWKTYQTSVVLNKGWACQLAAAGAGA